MEEEIGLGVENVEIGKEEMREKMKGVLEKLGIRDLKEKMM
nr:hypothetical protein [Bacillus subtilis]